MQPRERNIWKNKKSTQGGLSLIELLAVIAILGVISGITLAGYNKFSDQTIVTNLANDIGLSIRLAQSYGLNVRRHGNTFNTSYGVHFAKGTNNSYILYADQNRSADNYKYSGDKVKTYTISSGYIIKDVCATPSGGGNPPPKCFSGNGINSLDIAFDRPDPDAHFTSNASTNYQSANIVIRSPRGVERTIRVLSTGYISIQ